MGQMMVPFEAPQLPAHIAALGQAVSGDDLTSGTGGGFPVISIKGKVFNIVRGDQREMVTRSDSDEPAGSIEVVIIRANPNLSKTYYAEGYQEGAEDKPTCYSDNGIEPAADAAEKQSVKCATCPHNQWGTKISQDRQSKAKACADVRRLAVAPINLLNDPMLLRVPAASLKALGQYGDTLKKRGVKYPSIVTKISFDFAQAFPSLTFHPVAFVTEQMASVVAEQMGSDLVAKIVGLQNAAPQVAPPVTSGSGTVALASPKVEASAPVKETRVSAPAAAAPAPKRSKTASAFASATQAGATPPAAAPAPSVQKSKAIEVKTDNLDAELEAVLNQAGFDDK